MKNKTIRQFINELEKIALDEGDNALIKIRIKMTGIPKTKYYYEPLLRIENSKTSPQIVICP